MDTGGINHVIYNSTIKNNDSIDYYYFKKDFYINVLEELKDYAKIFYAVYENRKSSMAIIFLTINLITIYLL